MNQTKQIKTYKKNSQHKKLIKQYSDTLNHYNKKDPFSWV